MLTLWVPLFNIRIQQIRKITFNDYTHANDFTAKGREKPCSWWLQPSKRPNAMDR